jgi:hypothetical protein
MRQWLGGAALLVAITSMAASLGCGVSRPSVPGGASNTSSAPASPSASAADRLTLTADHPSARSPVPAGTDARVVRLSMVELVNPSQQSLLVVVSVQDTGTPPHQLGSGIFSPYPPDALTGFAFGLSSSTRTSLSESGGALVVTVGGFPDGVALRPDLRMVVEVRLTAD